MVQVNDLAITSLDTISAFELATNGGALMFVLDELQNATIGQTQEKTDITGKGGRKLTSLKRNKSVTISGTNGMLSSGLLELQTGSDFNAATNTAIVSWIEYPTVANTTYKAEITYNANGGALTSVYLKDSDGVIIKELEVTTEETIAAGKYKYTAPSGSTLGYVTISATDYALGTDLVVAYSRKISAANVMNNSSESFSKKCQLYVDALAEDKCGKIYHVQFYFPKADFDGEFSFDMGDNQTVHEFNAESLANACGGGQNLWTYTIFDQDVTDAA